MVTIIPSEKSTEYRLQRLERMVIVLSRCCNIPSPKCAYECGLKYEDIMEFRALLKELKEDLQGESENERD